VGRVTQVPTSIGPPSGAEVKRTLWLCLASGTQVWLEFIWLGGDGYGLIDEG
jgi:hypothetical protein